MSDVKELAFQIAKIAFEEKIDKGGKPYFNHLVRVAEKFKEDDFLYPIAMLHDLLEDCSEWNVKSLGCLFSENIVKTIELLTRKSGQDYFDYINEINQSSWATKIKLADLKDNMDITRLKTITDKDFERLGKYLKAYKILTSETVS
jgi:(p)ppGpp synthase/HD superfamily hydrolase